MKPLVLIAEYMMQENVQFLDQCDTHAYVEEYVFIPYSINRKGVIKYREPIWTNAVAEGSKYKTCIGINVHEAVDKREEIYKLME